MVCQVEIIQIPIISENKYEMPGAVIKSPFFQTEILSSNIPFFYQRALVQKIYLQEEFFF